MEQHPRNPYLAVDCIIRIHGGKDLVLIKRKNPPFGLALPGGFVEYGESLETAICREAMEETGLELELLQQFKAFSDPKRDPRQHIVSVVFCAWAYNEPKAGDDATEIVLIDPAKFAEYEYANDESFEEDRMGNLSEYKYSWPAFGFEQIKPDKLFLQFIARTSSSQKRNFFRSIFS